MSKIMLCAISGLILLMAGLYIGMHEGIKLGTTAWVFATSPTRLAWHVRYLGQLSTERHVSPDCRNEVFLTSDLLAYVHGEPQHTWFLPEAYAAIVRAHPEILKGIANYRKRFPIDQGYFKNCDLDEAARSEIVQAWKRVTDAY